MGGKKLKNIIKNDLFKILRYCGYLILGMMAGMISPFLIFFTLSCASKIVKAPDILKSFCILTPLIILFILSSTAIFTYVDAHGFRLALIVLITNGLDYFIFSYVRAKS